MLISYTSNVFQSEDIPVVFLQFLQPTWMILTSTWINDITFSKRLNQQLKLFSPIAGLRTILLMQSLTATPSLLTFTPQLDNRITIGWGPNTVCHLFTIVYNDSHGESQNVWGARSPCLLYRVFNQSTQDHTVNLRSNNYEQGNCIVSTWTTGSSQLLGPFVWVDCTKFACLV